MEMICEMSAVMNSQRMANLWRVPIRGSDCHHAAVTSMNIKSSGTLPTTAYCNIHGLWEKAKTIKVD